MSDVIQQKKDCAIGSVRSTLYGASNRIVSATMIPVIPLSFILETYNLIIALLLVTIVEFVIRYALGTTKTDMFRSLFFKLFSSKRKRVRN